MKAQNKILFFIICMLLYQFTIHALSQTEAYLKTLGPTREQAYEKIKKYFTAPSDPYNRKSPLFEFVDLKTFEPLINQAIETEKKNSNYYVLYHASQKEGILLALLRTYIDQKEKVWARNDFFILRGPQTYYTKAAATAKEYIYQNLPNILQQYYPPANQPNLLCVNWMQEKCNQFDFQSPWRENLISTSPAFIAGVDPAEKVTKGADGEWHSENREKNEVVFAAWESSFYYFTTNLSWSHIRNLYKIVVGDLKGSHPLLFQDSASAINARKYIAIKYNKIVDILTPHIRQKLGSQEIIKLNTGMMFQIFIPKNLIDAVAYPAWANGILWQRTMNELKNGWDDTIGAYTQLSPILELFQTAPEKLGRSINLLQVRIILKDKPYFLDPSSPVKINLIHSLPTSLFRVIEDSLKMIASVVVESNTAIKKGTGPTWLEQSNIEPEIQKNEAQMKKMLASNTIEDQREGMNALYYYALIGIEVPLAVQEANKYKNSNDKELKEISEKLLYALVPHA